ncbi:uncharacterized protein VICG_00847 [Vittaforma corneae ATCC 50505]|uniref:Phospholipid/glycerol acyltransferase domain-containing protein n=1 Tax=Vittaforma corneae (strain ATCC 50505) TaxID=993615 RepID=L2GNL7_VITCO|nr:uncharacterized protein VICG_00847 [Vittaforma corneae ATCC 50505]ELA42204.1 hypothetical protein VICG_00847 [Vittaforma corneae ATCC 50505]
MRRSAYVSPQNKPERSKNGHKKAYKYKENIIIDSITKRYLRVAFKMVLGVLLVCNMVLCIPILLCSFAARPFDRRLSNSIATITSYTCWTIIDWVFRISTTMDVPDIPKGNYLVVSNHISALDFALINRVNKHMFSHSKYAFKKSLRYVPVFYQGFLALNYLILERNFEKDRSNIVEYVQDLKKHRYPIWLVLFCEGCRFSSMKKELSDKFCKEKNMEPFVNVLTPRHKGFSIIKDELRGSYVDKVLDLTFYCDRKDFSILNLLCTGQIYEFKCDARIVSLDEIEKSEEFLMESFRRKDRLIETWKKEHKKN